MDIQDTNTKKCVIGIDPGKNGGISLFTLINGRIRFKGACKTPLAGDELYSLLLGYGLSSLHTWDYIIYIEDVHSMPRDGHQAAFSFGWATGYVYGVLSAFHKRITIKKVSPQKWQNFFKIKKEKTESSYQWKKRLTLLANKLVSTEVSLNRATADSALIGLYGANQEKVGNQ